MWSQQLCKHINYVVKAVAGPGKSITASTKETVILRTAAIAAVTRAAEATNNNTSYKSSTSSSKRAAAATAIADSETIKGAGCEAAAWEAADIIKTLSNFSGIHKLYPSTIDRQTDTRGGIDRQTDTRGGIDRQTDSKGGIDRRTPEEG